METTFHKLLETLEGMNLPEGEYLKMTNTLKAAFDTRENEKDSTTITPATPIVLKLMKTMMKMIEIEVEIKKIEGGFNKLVFLEVRTKNTKTGGVVTRQESRNLRYYHKTAENDAFRALLRTYIHRYRPLNITLLMDDIETSYTLEMMKEHEEEEDTEAGMEDSDIFYDYDCLFLRMLPCRIEDILEIWANGTSLRS
jgi:hypothetical protein